MRPIIDLLRSSQPQKPFLPPTLIYNEGWLLRIVLNWFSQQATGDSALDFLHGARWFSEALLPSPFLARYQGDPLSEAHTHADGVIGHFYIGHIGKTDLTLAASATQLVVLEAKISSSLSSGAKNAPYYDQAARNVACIAEVLRRAKRPPANMDRLGFYLLAPQNKIASSAFSQELDQNSIHAKVKKRVSAYNGEREEWFSNWFEPALDRLSTKALSWEQVLAGMEATDPEAFNSMSVFYQTCLEVS